MQKNAKGQVLFDKICEKIAVAEKDYFGVRYIDEKDGQVFHHKMQLHFPNTRTYGLLTQCEVKMAGYWPSSFSCVFMDRDKV